MQLKSASVNEVQTGHTARPFNAVEYIRNYDSLSWINKAFAGFWKATLPETAQEESEN